MLTLIDFFFLLPDVYDQLSHHFSDERYRPWPRVRHFLEQLEPGSLVCDAGNSLHHHLIISKKSWKKYLFFFSQVVEMGNTCLWIHWSSNWDRTDAKRQWKRPEERITRSISCLINKWTIFFLVSNSSALIDRHTRELVLYRAKQSHSHSATLSAYTLSLYTDQ